MKESSSDASTAAKPTASGKRPKAGRRPARERDHDPEITSLCEMLRDRTYARGARDPFLANGQPTAKWRQDMRRLLETVEQRAADHARQTGGATDQASVRAAAVAAVEETIDVVMNHPWWGGKIFSPGALDRNYEKFLELRKKPGKRLDTSSNGRGQMQITSSGLSHLFGDDDSE